jgi:6-phosphogluconolactonase
MQSNIGGFWTLVCLIAAVSATVATPGFCQPSKDTIPFYIGTYTGGASRGIYRSELNTADGSLAEPKLVAELANPSFLSIHPKLNVLYAVSEVMGGGDNESTQVCAYKIADDGSLQLLGGQAAGGDIPCYVSTDKQGKFAFVANYGSGSVISYPIQADGSLGAMVSQVQHTGKSVNAQRQESPHAHCFLVDPSNQFVLSADLGTDQVLIYRLDPQTGKLTSTNRPLQLEPGNGPRHLTFHPDGKHAFVIHELTSKLSALSWNDQTGELAELNSVSTLPADFTGNNSTAEVLVHPNGKFVYGSNRGHHSIAGFAFDAKSGKLTSLGNTPTRGKTPRNFRIDPSGTYLLAENQDSDSIFVYRIDQQSGSLEPLPSSVTVGSPVCIRFLLR